MVERTIVEVHVLIICRARTKSLWCTLPNCQVHVIAKFNKTVISQCGFNSQRPVDVTIDNKRKLTSHRELSLYRTGCVHVQNRHFEFNWHFLRIWEIKANDFGLFCAIFVYRQLYFFSLSVPNNKYDHMYQCGLN